MRGTLLKTGILCLAVAALLAAQRGPGRGGPGRAPGVGRSGPVRPGAGRTAVDRWNSMTPEEREEALKKLPRERQQKIRERIEKFNSLPENQQKWLRERYQRFSELPPEKQELVRRQLRNFSSTPPERRRELAHEFRDLRGMAPEDRRARLDSEDFHARYSTSERQMLEDLSDNLSPRP